MDMISALNSINISKQNLMRDDVGNTVEAEVKGYPAFPVMRSLSYHQDVILIINMLNEVGLQSFGVNPQQHYEFLLHAVPKAKRFAKWAKQDKEEDIELLMETFPVSYEKAKDILSLIGEADMQRIRNSKGGDEKMARIRS
jgi:NACalpha-BTF3-like transcription factor